VFDGEKNLGLDLLPDAGLAEVNGRWCTPGAELRGLVESRR